MSQSDNEPTNLPQSLYRLFGVIVLFLLPTAVLYLKLYSPPQKPAEVPAPPPSRILPLTHLEEVLGFGELVVATRISPTTVYTGADGRTGFEFDLVHAFAESLGVDVRFVVVETISDLLQLVREQDVDLVAAGLTVTPERQQFLRFSPSYQDIRAQLVYRQGEDRPRNLEDTCGDYIEVMTDSSHAETLLQLQQEVFCLLPQVHSRLNSEELLEMVAQGQMRYTLADSNEVGLIRHYYPELRVAFDVGPTQKLAWAFDLERDTSLYQAASLYLRHIKESGYLAELVERYYGHAESFDYVGTRKFIREIESKLPRYEDYFRQAAEGSGLDWRLLAAVGYQESHWNPRAVSPTGVRGLMMLTRATARQLDIKNRRDPAQSILGGARYLASLHSRIPERIREPDRTWMALAAYNVGLGHLEDARVLAQSQGHDPDKWSDVREALPLLSRKKWYSKTRFGYARGWEPVRYVGNIRTYYNILVWLTEKERRQRLLAEVDTDAVPAAPAPEGPEKKKTPPPRNLEDLVQLLPLTL